MQAKTAKTRDDGGTEESQIGTRAHITTAELAGKSECAKNLKDLNKELAKYSSLVVALGSSTDSEPLREALRRSRKKACDLAKQNKHKLLPHLRCRNVQEEGKEFENLWAAYSSCLELFETQMMRTLSLQMFFTFTSDSWLTKAPQNLIEHSQKINATNGWNGAPVLIQTGLQDPIIGSTHYRAHTASVEHLDDGGPADRKSRDRDELRMLEKDLVDIRDMQCYMQRLVDVNPWTVEPDIKLVSEGIKALSVGSEEDSNIDMQSTTTASLERGHTRRRLCIVGSVTVACLLAALVLGLCIKFLT